MIAFILNVNEIWKFKKKYRIYKKTPQNSIFDLMIPKIRYILQVIQV